MKIAKKLASFGVQRECVHPVHVTLEMTRETSHCTAFSLYSMLYAQRLSFIHTLKKSKKWVGHLKFEGGTKNLKEGQPALVNCFRQTSAVVRILINTI